MGTCAGRAKPQFTRTQTSEDQSAGFREFGIFVPLAWPGYMPTREVFFTEKAEKTGNWYKKWYLAHHLESGNNSLSETVLLHEDQPVL